MRSNSQTTRTMERARLAARRLLRTALAAALPQLLAAAPFVTADAAEPAPTLSEIGAQLDEARVLPADQRAPAIAGVSESFEARMKAGLPNDERGAAAFLSGEIRTALGQYDKAAEAYRKAEQEGASVSFADDAAFASISASEAAGHDKEAARAWIEWEKKYPKSPLVPEERLARAWNAMRRGALPEAIGLLEGVRTSYPWIARDPRFVLSRATAAYLDGHEDDAIAMLEGAKGAPETYLRALCYSRRGDVLKAAAYFQEAADRSPAGSLRDHALLAKANAFLEGKAPKSAADEFARVMEEASSPEVRNEAELRHAACLYMGGEPASAIEALRQTALDHPKTQVAARAQYLLGEVLTNEKRYDEAIVELNRVLTDYFESEIAAAAQYRVGRCLDALGKSSSATSTYQAVVSGYPMAPEAPAAAYLAGVGLLEEKRPLESVPYFQIVIDRYAKTNAAAAVAFSSPEHQELVEAALCLLELAYHRAGNLAQLAGMPHLMLTKMPPSASLWRANALLIDADAMAAMGRYTESQDLLATLVREFAEEAISVRATRLLAWTYAREGKDELAVKTEEEMLARYASLGDVEELATAYLNRAHVLMNRKQYSSAASAYEDFLGRFPEHPQSSLALFQLGLAYHRLDRDGDAVDRWERITSVDPSSAIAEKAWTRAADVYFQAEHYDDAKRCYEGLVTNFASGPASSRGLLRIAQCEYNAGRDPEALERFSEVVAKYPESREATEAQRGIELALYRLGQKENASEVLTQLVEKYPQSSFAADAQFQVAMGLYKKNDFASAADAFRQVVSRFPGFSGADRATFLEADSYEQAGDKESARKTYEQFLIFFPESDLRSTVRFRVGTMHFQDGDYMQAAVDFTTLLETSPSAESPGASGPSAGPAGTKTPPAKTAGAGGPSARTAAAEQPSAEVAGAALYNLALCQKILGRMDEARQSFERYRRAYPNDERAADVALQLSEIHEKAGETDAAMAEMEKAATSSPPSKQNAELNYKLGLARERREDLDGALGAYQKAIDSPAKADAFRLSALGRAAAIYEGQGKTDRALAAYRDLIQNATDPELVAAANERVDQLTKSSKKAATSTRTASRN